MEILYILTKCLFNENLFIFRNPSQIRPKANEMHCGNVFAIFLSLLLVVSLSIIGNIYLFSLQLNYEDEKSKSLHFRKLSAEENKLLLDWGILPSAFIRMMVA